MRKVNRFLLYGLMVSIVAWGTALYAAEHPGATQGEAGTTKEHAGTTKEHAGTTKEHAGTTPAVATMPVVPAAPPQRVLSVEPTNEAIRSAMQVYALQVTNQNGGFFPIHDEKTGKDRRLSFQQVHQRVGKISTRDGYFSCADFVDQETGEVLDVDFWVTLTGGQLQVTASEIHKINGQPRFTYNEKDEKIILN